MSMTYKQIEAALGYQKHVSGEGSNIYRYDPIFITKTGERIGIVRHSSKKGEWHYHRTYSGEGYVDHCTRSIAQGQIEGTVRP